VNSVSLRFTDEAEASKPQEDSDATPAPAPKSDV